MSAESSVLGVLHDESEDCRVLGLELPAGRIHHVVHVERLAAGMSQWTA